MPLTPITQMNLEDLDPSLFPVLLNSLTPLFNEWKREVVEEEIPEDFCSWLRGIPQILNEYQEEVA